MSDILNLEVASLLAVVLRSVIVYLVLLLLLRLFGKRELGQLAPFDLVLLLIISNSVQNAMVGDDTSLNGGLIAAATLLLVNWVVDRFALKSKWFRRGVIGSPTLLVCDGEFLREHMEREGISNEEIMQAVRSRGISNLKDVRWAILEVDGSISVIQEDGEEDGEGGRGHRTRTRGRAPKN